MHMPVFSRHINSLAKLGEFLVVCSLLLESSVDNRYNPRNRAKPKIVRGEATSDKGRRDDLHDDMQGVF